MANVESIKATIDANIVPNGNNSITGGILNQVLNEMADGTGECVREEVHEGVTYAEAGGIATPNIWYVMPDMADGKEDDIILTENNTKKINGQSLLGKGNLEIGGDVTELRNEITAIQGVTDSLSSQLDSQQTNLNQQSAKLTELSEETDARFNESAESTREQIRTLEDKAENKFASVDSEIENLKRGEAYVMGESLVFRNYANAQIIGCTLTL